MPFSPQTTEIRLNNLEGQKTMTKAQHTPTKAQLAELLRIKHGKNWKTTCTALIKKGWVAAEKGAPENFVNGGKYVTFAGLKAIAKATGE